MPAKRAPVTNSAFYRRVAGYACYIITVFGLLIFGLYYGIFSSSSSSPEQQQSSAPVNERYHNSNHHHHRRSAVAFRFDTSNQLLPNNHKPKQNHDDNNKFEISDQSQKLFEEGGSHLVSSFSILNGEEEFNLNNNKKNNREREEEINSPSAFVTIIYSEADIIPTMTLLHSLKKTDSKIRHRVVLVVSSSTSSSSSLKTKISSLSLLATRVLEIDPIPSPFFTGATSSADDLHRLSSTNEFTKLRLFELIQFRKILFVDCHSVLVRNIDYLLLFDDDYYETTVGGPSMILEGDDQFSSRMMIVRPSLSSLHYFLGEVLYKLSAADRTDLARARDPVAFLLRVHQFKKQAETEVVVDRSVISKWNLLDIASDSDFKRLDDPRIRGVFLSSSSSSSSPNLQEHDDEPLPWVKSYFDESITNYREVTFQERFIEVLPFTSSLTRRLGLQLRHDQEEEDKIRRKNHDHSSSSSLFNDWLANYHDHENDDVDHSSIRRRSGYYIWFSMFHTLLSDIVHFINKGTDLSSSSTSSLLHQKIFTKVGGKRRLSAGVVLQDPQKWLLEISLDIVHEVEASSSSSSDSKKLINSTKQLINDTLQQKRKIEVVCDTCMFHPEFGYHYYTDCENVVETNSNDDRHHHNHEVVNEFYSSSEAGRNQRNMNDENNNQKVMHVTKCSDSSCEECSWIGVFAVGDDENRELFSENALHNQHNKNNRHQHRHRDRISLKNQREYSLKLLGRGRNVDRKKFDWIIKSEELKKKKTSSIFDDQRVLRSHPLPLEFQQQSQLLYLIPTFSTNDDLLQIHCDENSGRISLKRKRDKTTIVEASPSSSSSTSTTLQFNLNEEFTQRTIIPRLLGSARFSSLSPSFSSQSLSWTLSCVRADEASIFSIGGENATNNASSSTMKRRRRKPTARTNNIKKEHHQKMNSLVLETSLYNPNCIESTCSSSSSPLTTVLNFETCECFAPSSAWFSTSQSNHHHGDATHEVIIKSFKRVFDGEMFDQNVMTDFFFASSTSSSVSSPEESASSQLHYYHSLIANDKLLVAPVKYNICEKEDDDDEGSCSTFSTTSVEVQIFLKKTKEHDEHQYPNFALDGDEILIQLQNAMEEKFYQHHSKLMSFMKELFSINDDEEDNDIDKNEKDKNNKRKKRRGRSHFRHHHHHDVLPWFVKFILMILIAAVSVYCVVTIALKLQHMRHEACRKKVMDRKAV